MKLFHLILSFQLSVLALCAEFCATSSQVNTENGLKPNLNNSNNIETVLNKWRDISKFLEENIQSVVQKALPSVLNVASDADLSPKCEGALLTLLQGLLTMKSWAFEMLDASGKPLSAMLLGSFRSMGSYDECVAIEVKTESGVEIKFRGSYCKLQITPPLPPKPEFYTVHHKFKEFENFTDDESVIQNFQELAVTMYNIPIGFGLCLPSTCSIDDLERLIQSMTDSFLPNTHFEVAIAGCEGKPEKKWTTTQKIIAVTYIVLVTLNVLSTFFHYFYQRYIEGQKNKQNISIKIKILCSFSWYKSVPSIFNSSSSLEPAFLHSLRALSLIWIIMANSFICLNLVMISQSLYLKGFTTTFWQQFMFNLNSPIETIIFTTAYFMGFKAKMLDSSDVNLIFIVKLFAVRILRILPIILTVIGMAILFPLTTSGPLWREVAKPYEENCINNWWTNVLFVNNFIVEPNTRCLFNSWFLSVEVQLFVFGLCLLILASKLNTFMRLSASTILILASILTTGYLTVYYNSPPVILISEIDKIDRMKYENQIQEKPFCHVSTWILGMLAGFYFTNRPKINMKSNILWIGWIVVIMCTAAISFGVFSWNREEKVNALQSAIYSSLYRPGWSLCLTWICFVCSNGSGKTLNSVLSWSAWLPVSRMFYFYYLTFPIFQDMVFAQGRELLQPSLYLALFLFSGILVVGGHASILCSCLVQQPVETLIGIFSMTQINYVEQTPKKIESPVPLSKFVFTNGQSS